MIVCQNNDWAFTSLFAGTALKVTPVCESFIILMSMQHRSAADMMERDAHA